MTRPVDYWNAERMRARSVECNLRCSEQPARHAVSLVATVLILLGLGVYLGLWFDSSVVPYSQGPGEWGSAPAWLRKAVRRGPGPVLIAAVAVQAAGAVTFVVGVIRQLEFLEFPVSELGAWTIVLSWCAALATWGLLAIRARRWPHG